MASLEEYINSIKSLKKNLSVIVDKSVMLNDNYYIDTLTGRLMSSGRDGDGSSLGGYSDAYKIYKLSIGAVSNHVTLFNEGGFYEKMFLTSKKGIVKIFSSDSKTRKLIEMYSGFDLFGLTENEQEYLVVNFIDPDIQDEIDKLPSVIKLEI